MNIINYILNLETENENWNGDRNRNANGHDEEGKSDQVDGNSEELLQATQKKNRKKQQEPIPA